ncbi:MAG: hypothetical protein ACRYGI_10725 [Janthinobacterium lividum]
MIASRRLAGAACLVAAPVSAHFAVALGHAQLAAEVLTSLQLTGICCLLLAGSGSDARRTPRKRPLHARLWLLPAILLWLAALQAPARLVLLLDAASFHAVIQASLLLLFAGSLRPGHEPLVTLMARRIHGTLRPDITAYTRHVTLAWCLFFALQIGLSASLLSAGLTGWLPIRWWWIAVPDSCLPATIAMFVMEYGVRRWLITDFEHVGFRVAISAFRNRASGVS